MGAVFSRLAGLVRLLSPRALFGVLAQLLQKLTAALQNDFIAGSFLLGISSSFTESLSDLIRDIGTWLFRRAFTTVVVPSWEREAFYAWLRDQPAVRDNAVVRVQTKAKYKQVGKKHDVADQAQPSAASGPAAGEAELPSRRPRSSSTRAIAFLSRSSAVWPRRCGTFSA